MNVRARRPVVSQKRLWKYMVLLCACEIGDASVHQIKLGIVHQVPGLVDREQAKECVPYGTSRVGHSHLNQTGRIEVQRNVESWLTASDQLIEERTILAHLRWRG